MNFLATVLERKGHDGILRGAVLVDHRSGYELGKNHPAIGRPAKRIDDVAERRVAAREFLALQQPAPLASGFLQPDIVALQIVLLGVKMVPRGIDNAPVRRESKSRNVVINIEQRLFDVRTLRV